MPQICPECGAENSSSAKRCKVCNEQLKHISHRKKKRIVACFILAIQAILLITAFLPILFSIGEFGGAADSVNVFFSKSVFSIAPGNIKNVCAAATVISLAISVGIYSVVVTGKHIRRKYKFIVFAPVLALLFSTLVIIVANSMPETIVTVQLATVNMTGFGFLWIALHVISCILTYVYSEIKK